MVAYSFSSSLQQAAAGGPQWVIAQPGLQSKMLFQTNKQTNKNYYVNIYLKDITKSAFF